MFTLKPLSPEKEEVENKDEYTDISSTSLDSDLDGQEKFYEPEEVFDESYFEIETVIVPEDEPKPASPMFAWQEKEPDKPKKTEPSQIKTFYEGETVFDVLQREMINEKIHFEFSNNPVYNAAYVEGIGNLYEFDCGSLSGWTYSVNGWFPNYGCSRYLVSEGDRIEWLYTCDLGEDVGGTMQQ
jgi:hypothetical protein